MIHCLVYLLCKGGFIQKILSLENVFQKSNDFHQLLELELELELAWTLTLPFMLNSIYEINQEMFFWYFFLAKNLHWLA